MVRKNKFELFSENIDFLSFWTVFALGCYIYSFFRYDNLEVSIITVMSWFGSGWASNPSDWFGLHKVLDAIQVYFIVPTIFLLAFVFWITDIREESKKQLDSARTIKGGGDK